MSRPDEGLIHTWLDGELDAAESARVEALVKSDPEWAAAAAEARGLIAASSRIIGALDDVPANVVPATKPVAKPVAGVTPIGATPAAQPPRRQMPTWLRAAAAIVVVVGSLTVLSKSSDPELQRVVESKDEAVTSTRAADTQANAPAGGAREADARRSNAVADAAGKTAAAERSAAAPPQVAQNQPQAPAQVQSQVQSQLQTQTQLRQQASGAGAGAAAPVLARLDSAEQRKVQSDSLGALKKEDEKLKAASAAPASAGLAATARDAGATGNRVRPETKALLSEVVTTGSADSRRAFAGAEAGPVGEPMCYREPGAGSASGILHRVVRASDTTAVASPAAPSLGAAANQQAVAQRARAAPVSAMTYRLKGDTLFVPLSTGETRIAIKAPCP
jgi:hypothetical protein